jgi:chemotaxis protein MotB
MSDIPNLAQPFQFRPPSRAPLVLLILVLTGSAVVAYWQFQEKEKANTAAKGAKQDLKAALAKIAEIEAAKTQLETEKSELEIAKNELAKNVQAKEGEIAELKGTYDKIQDKMKAEIAKGEINLEQTGGKLRVGLVDKVLFDSGEAQISKRGEGVLARVAEALAGIPDKQIQVSGHTDQEPITSKLATQYPTNWELSVARATNVVRFLAEKAKLPPERLVASGHGEYQPIASNKTPAGRARNRRIEILLTPLLAPKTLSKAKLKEAAAASEKSDASSDKATEKKTDKAKKSSKKKAHSKSKHRKRAAK